MHNVQVSMFSHRRLLTKLTYKSVSSCLERVGSLCRMCDCSYESVKINIIAKLKV